jgi:ferrous iron transport protein B
MNSQSAAAQANVIAIFGNPNSGKTTIFNAITGLHQNVGNYPGVTVEKISGYFRDSGPNKRRYELIDIPGTYSLAAFSPDEYIAASALYGGIGITQRPDSLICVIDASNLERGLYLLLQVLEVGIPVVVALNMLDVARRRRTTIDIEKLSAELGGIPVVPVIASRGEGIAQLQQAACDQVGKPAVASGCGYGSTTENFLAALSKLNGSGDHTRAELLRIIFDVEGPAEMKFLADLHERGGDRVQAQKIIGEGRDAIRGSNGVLSGAETLTLSTRAMAIGERVISREAGRPRTRSEQIDRLLLHPVLGPILLVLMMTFVFQSIFSWAEPFMAIIDTVFGRLSDWVGASMSEGPLESLLTDGVIGGVGSVLIFLPQIIILFLFIALLEDSGYMARAAFLVDRMFRWCGLSGKSFIPMLSSFACAIPGILATRTIEDRKLRLITILVAPLMTCSARLPVYAIMIAAFVPYERYFGVFNLQGLTLTGLYFLGIFVAVIVSFVLQKTLLKTDRGTFMMEMPSYKVPTMRSVLVRVFNRARSFIVRAGTVIMAITIIIWALSYFPRSTELTAQYQTEKTQLLERFELDRVATEELIRLAVADLPEDQRAGAMRVLNQLEPIGLETDLRKLLDREPLLAVFPEATVGDIATQRWREMVFNVTLAEMRNQYAGASIRNSYFGRLGRFCEPVFRPLGWDWRIGMSVLASFPAREVIIATLGTIYNLGTDVDEESSGLVDKMRQVTWEDGPRKGERVFTTAVAFSIMIFFALSCQCGATLATVRQETGNWYYSLGVFVYMTSLAYAGSLAVYQVMSKWTG